jgi:hypothetical protein
VDGDAPPAPEREAPPSAFRALALIALLLSLLPMALVTVANLSWVGKGCIPGREHGLDEMLGLVAICWGFYLVPAVPAWLLFKYRARSTLGGVGALLVAILAGMVALFDVVASSFATLC